MIVDTEDLAAVSKLGEMFGVTPSAVCMWAKRYSNFPKPVPFPHARVTLYSITEVQEWLEQATYIPVASTASK
jgi:hypothetical protein